MRGRKPQPTALRVLRGNPGRRPINAAEPQHEPLSTDCPVELVDQAAQDEWRRIAPLLLVRGQVTTVDRGTLIGYCLKYGQWQALEAEARRHPFVVRSPSNYPMPNPAVGMANKAFALMLKAAAELGITPSARSRVSVQEAPVTSKWGDAL